MSVVPNATQDSRRGFLPSFAHLSKDVPASLVVFLVAIPLSLGIALASGAPIMAGIIAAACGGIIAGIVAGAPLQVSGPAAGLTAIVFAFTQQLGWPLMCVATIIAGLLQLAFGSVKVARICLAVSPAVVHGMLAGIGISIVLSQLHIVLGGKPESKPLINLAQLPGQIIHMHTPATFLGVLMIALLLLWQTKYIPARLKAIPGSLVAIIVVTLLSVVFNMDVARIDLKGGLSAGFQFPQLPPAEKWGAVLIAGVTVGLVASVESLLCAVATDKLHTGPRADLDRELIGQGLANTVSGALGGLPVTGVIVRSSANIKAGARTQLSAILHGVWVLVAVALLASVIQKIPLAALAGLLVYVGIQLVNVHHIKSVLTHREALIYFVTVAGVVCLNLLEGVALGIALAIFLLLKRLTAARITVEDNPERKRWHVRIDGSLTFVTVPKLTQALAQVPAGAAVDVDLMVDFMDQAAFEALHNWKTTFERMGGRADIDEIHEAWYQSAAEGAPRREKDGIGNVMTTLLGRRRDRAAPTVNDAGQATFAPEDGLDRDGRENSSQGPLLEGVREFQRTGASSVRPLLEQLARDGQEPTELFITCSDSRVVPTLFTSSGPGDLFKVRNIGNLVPPCEGEGAEARCQDTAVASAVEYALEVLNVGSIVVCGHSNCGAMKALLEGGDLSSMPSVRDWLRYGGPSVTRFNTVPDFDPSRGAVDQLAQVNVVQQLEHLRTHPIVRQREQEGRLRLIGMFFDIETAAVLVYSPRQERFVAIERQEEIEPTLKKAVGANA
jgi:carbonic anhydrase